MTNGNDPIVQTVYRQTGENDYRPATQKEITQGIYLVHKEGLSKREYFASNEQLAVDELSSTAAKILMNSEVPKVYDLAAIKWWLSAEMKFRVLKADALIEALNVEATNSGLVE